MLQVLYCVTQWDDRICDCDAPDRIVDSALQFV
jgi:hypothetical protein